MWRKRTLVAVLGLGLGCSFGDNRRPLTDAGRPADASTADADPSELRVVEVAPAAQSLVPAQVTEIGVRFDRMVLLETFDGASFWAFGQWSGRHAGGYTLDDDGLGARFSSGRPFIGGELVTVVVANSVRSTTGAMPRAGGYSWQFRVGTTSAGMQFSEVATLSTKNSGGAFGQAYGGVATDLDRDGFPDISIVNESSEDVVVFLNRGDGTGMLDRVAGEVEVGVRPSPSEPGDFDGDGDSDLAVANIGSGITVLLGRGDGTFDVQNEIFAGRTPRGVTSLDFDGDGDFDLLVANTRDSNLTPLVNDGAGRFAAGETFDGYGNGEWAVTAADMNEDGLLDLVVGSHDDGMITVLTADGTGGFNYREARQGPVGLWMLNVADLDGDLHADVAVAGGFADNGAILLGDGTGGLSEATTYGTDPSTSATDLGDLDGDGDLDWVLSSFGGSDSDWSFWRNLGDGSFELITEWDSPQDASCALLVDLDLDGDLDLGLIDEAEDVLILLENQ